MEFLGYFFYRSEVSIILKLFINIDSLSIDLFNKDMRNSGDNFLLNRCYMRNTTCTSNCCPLELDVVSQMGALHHSTLVQMQDHIQESFEKKCTFSLWFSFKPFSRYSCNNFDSWKHLHNKILFFLCFMWICR